MSRLRTFTILSLLVFVLASIFIYPNFNTKLPAWWKYAFPDNRLNLGLDLKGGISIVLGVDEEKVLPVIFNEEETRIRDDLILNKILIRGTNISSNGIKILFFDKKSLIDAKKIIKIDSIEENLENLYLLIKIDDKKLNDRKILLLRQVKDILNNRIDQFGVVESSIQLASNDRILVQIPGVGESQRSRILKIISKTALLEFKPVIQEASTEQLLFSKFGKDKIGTEFIIYESPDSESNSYFITKFYTPLLGSSIKDAYVAYDQLNRPYVAFSLDSKGTEVFSKMTQDNIGKKIAVVLDGKVKSAPTVQDQIFGRGSISGNYTFDDANDLAIILKSGSLPIPIKILQEKTIGPSLGEDSINRGKISMLFASLMIFVFMFIYYKKLGLVCDLALFFNIFTIFGLLSLFGVTLTFPGIAGLVLTLGMAVDGNIIIYERIKEEIAKGKEKAIAIDVGFEKSLSTILDANITTLIAALCLFSLGDGPIKGFALTLCVGIFSTIFSNVIFTRVVTRGFLKKEGVNI